MCYSSEGNVAFLWAAAAVAMASGLPLHGCSHGLERKDTGHADEVVNCIDVDDVQFDGLYVAPRIEIRDSTVTLILVTSRANSIEASREESEFTPLLAHDLAATIECSDGRFLRMTRLPPKGIVAEAGSLGLSATLVYEFARDRGESDDWDAVLLQYKGIRRRVQIPNQ